MQVEVPHLLLKRGVRTSGRIDGIDGQLSVELGPLGPLGQRVTGIVAVAFSPESPNPFGLRATASIDQVTRHVEQHKLGVVSGIQPPTADLLGEVQIRLAGDAPHDLAYHFWPRDGGIEYRGFSLRQNTLE